MPMIALLSPAGTCFTKSACAESDGPVAGAPTEVLVALEENWNVLPAGAAEFTSHLIWSVTGFPLVTLSGGEIENEFAPVTMLGEAPSAVVVEAPLVLKSLQFERLFASAPPPSERFTGIEFTLYVPPGLVSVIVPSDTPVPGVMLVPTGVEVIASDPDVLVPVLCAKTELPAKSTDMSAETKIIFFVFLINNNSD
jgi:hypothetical protein